MKKVNKKNKVKWILVGLLIIVCISFFFSYSPSFFIKKDITIDSLYVDYTGSLTAHIRNYRNSEECVKAVFQFYEENNYTSIWFISNKEATHIDHKRMYVDDQRTNRFSFSKCDSIPLSLSVLRLALKKDPKPIPFEMIRGEDSTYFKGDFVEMNFSILKSFKREVIFGKFEKKEYHTYVLVNKYGVYKFELSSYNPGMGDCRTYKIY